MAANPARGQLNREKHIFPVPAGGPENLISLHRFDHPVPRQPAYSPHSGGIWCSLAVFPPLSATACIYLYRQPLSDHSQVYRVTQLRTDGVHCRESADTEPVVLKVVQVTGAAFSGFTMDHFFMRLSLAIPSVGM